MNESERQRVRLQRTLFIVCAFLVLGAIFLLALPIRLPRPLRLSLAAVDLIAAATVWLLAKQNLRR